MDAKASSILSKLQNYDYDGIDKLFSDYLHPISLLISPEPQHSKKPSKSRHNHHRKQPEPEPELDPSSIRSLAKTFWPFIHQSLVLIPNRLSESPKHPSTQQSIAQLIDAYTLCLDCLDALSSQLSGKSYSVQLQRARFVNCLFRWHRYDDAIDEGFRVLKALGAVKLEGSQCKVTMGELVPRLVHDGDGDANAVDVEFVRLIVDTVSTIVASVSVSKTKDAGKYAALLILINEVRPLFRYWDPSARNKLQLKILACMKNAMKFLITEVMHFEGDLISEFCKVTFDEHIQLLNSQNLQDVMGKEVEEFVEFLSYTAYRCRSASTSVRVAVAMHMQQSACSFSKGLAYFSLIQRLYAIGMYLSEFSLQPNDFCAQDSKGPIHISSMWLSPECWDKLEDLCALLVSGKRYYCFNTNDYDKPLRCECGDFIAEVSPCCKVHEDSKPCMSENGANYLPYYLNALKFSCWPLAEFVNSQRKIIVAEKGESALGDALKLIHEALLEYCYLFPCCQMEKGARGQVDSIVVLICLAAFTLSLKLNLNIKGSKKLLNFLLSDNCIQTLQPKHLKNMISGLRYTFVAFYKDKQLKEASTAAKLCCRASWSHCLLLCEMLMDKQKGFDGELSETLITASLNEACKVSSLVVDVLHQLDGHKVEKVMVHSLDKWSLARNLFRRLPSPVALIKCWVEIQCKSYENTDTSAPVLASYLMCSPCTMKHYLQTEAVGIILEQELLEYQGMYNLYPKCSQRMQMEIIDILLKNIYDSNNCRRRADILMRKGMLYRASGIGGLENCIHLLSEAIESINNSDGIKAVTHEEAAAMSHQLAIIYCLRAMCTQEANPSSKDIFNDIRQAVILWLTMDIPDCLSAGLCDMGCEYVLLLLCHIADLLSIKGEMMIHLDVFNVIIRVFKRMNASLEKFLSLMWESRRFNHALCVVPLNEAFITALSGHYGKDAESLDFWINSMKESQPLLVGLRQNFSYLSTLFPLAFHQHMRSLGSEISVDEVKEVASDLVSKVPMSGHAAFLAGYLYHDLSERLSASGQMIEALFCAKEAYQVRNNLFLKHFSCSIERCEGRQDKDGISINLTVLNRIALRVWPGNGISQNSEDFILTQWNVLRCYLESTMQVGIIHEALGNVADAEHLFKTGKRISCWLDLPAFIVAFSSCLGKTYLGRCLLDAAHMELGTAEKVLASERKVVTCSRCLLMLESAIMEQLGNLYRRGGNSYRKAPNATAGNPYEFSIKRLLSLDKDDLAIWLEEANSAHTRPQDKVTMVEGSGCGWKTKTSDAAAAPLGVGCPRQPDKTRTKTEAKRSRNMKKVSESAEPGSCCVIDCNSRVTRSRKQSSRSKGFSCTERVEDVSNSCSKHKQECEARSVPNEVNCQKCFSDELRNYSSVTCAIQVKWEFIRRREILRLLIGLGKCEGASAGIPRLHRIYSKCISMLVGGNDCKCTSSFELEYIGKEICGDVFAVERAEICYNLCWLSLRALYSKDIRSVYCGPYHEMSKIVSLLMLAFVLSREVPLLFQEVSRLLALAFVVSSVRDNVASPLSSSKILSGNYWAAYFHQASVGAHHNLQLLSAKHKAQSPCKAKVLDSGFVQTPYSLHCLQPSNLDYCIESWRTGSEAAAPISMTADTFTLRFVPESVEEIEACVENFFKNLPSTTIVCISLLGDSCSGLLEEVMHYPSVVYGWMLLSHLNADSQPAVIILPLSSILQGEETSSSCSVLGERYLPKEWHSPWGCNAVVDNVAPFFKQILRENYASSSNLPDRDTDENRQIWWSWRENLDKCLRKLLRDMEESWFGAWRYLLLGQWLECEPLNSVVRELVQEVKLRYKYNVNEGVLKLVLRGIKPANLENKGIPSLFLQKGCYIGCGEDRVQESCNSQNEARDGADYVPACIVELMLTAVHKLEAEYCTRREPVILVLESDVQMFPLENMPILREQEVYRMPSVAIILATLQRRCILGEAASHASRFPLIDPLDAFYLLNPSGDLSRTQAEFEEWFRLLNLQGKAGVVPSTEELIGALENHDLFYYFGHGSGSQYMRPEKIQKLEKCAAILLMGCSSGSLKLNGDYPPAGPSLSYVLSGSPIVVANLWEVTDGEIDRFAKAVLKAFLDERSMSSSGCIQCSMLAEELKSLSVNERKGNTKKGRGRRKKPEADDGTPDLSAGYCFRHKLRTGYFVSKARNACKLPFLIGAAPVCYGVPTGIRKKKAV